MPRLLIVSDGLPSTLSDKSGKIDLQECSGGLATALAAHLESRKGEKDFEAVWVGWPGASLHGQRQTEFTAIARQQFSSEPVWMFSGEMDHFHHGFCDRTIWPLFHYLPSYAQYDDSLWEAYKRVNLLFRDVTLSIIRPGDTAWIHDHHLLLLPKLLRERAP